MRRCPLLWYCGLRLVDELYRSRAEVGASRAGPSLNAFPDHAGEPAVERAVVPAALEAREMEADPADHLVLEVRSRTLDRSVDREEQFGSDARRQSSLDFGGVEFRAGIRVVPIERHVGIEPVIDPIPQDVLAGSALGTVDVQDAERPWADL